MNKKVLFISFVLLALFSATVSFGQTVTVISVESKKIGQTDPVTNLTTLQLTNKLNCTNFVTVMTVTGEVYTRLFTPNEVVTVQLQIPKINALVCARTSCANAAPMCTIIDLKMLPVKITNIETKLLISPKS